MAFCVLCLNLLSVVPVAGISSGGEGELCKGSIWRHWVANPRASLNFNEIQCKWAFLKVVHRPKLFKPYLNYIKQHVRVKDYLSFKLQWKKWKLIVIGPLSSAYLPNVKYLQRTSQVPRPLLLVMSWRTWLDDFLLFQIPINDYFDEKTFLRISLTKCLRTPPLLSCSSSYALEIHTAQLEAARIQIV